MKNICKKPLTNAEKRVLIAKDVIAQIKREKYLAQPGLFISDSVWEAIGGSSYGSYDVDPDNPNRGEVLLKFIEEKEKNCEVCALGGAFVSAVKLFDKCSRDDIVREDSRATTHEYLKRWFSNDQMNLIESAFEGGPFVGVNGDEEAEYDEDGNEIIPKDIKKAIAFGERYQDAGERLMGIMRNIVRNKGTFVLPKRI